MCEAGGRPRGFAGQVQNKVGLQQEVRIQHVSGGLPMTPPAIRLRGSQPLYMMVAARLAAGIAEGKYPVGSRMPSEGALCEQFNASRFTIREAIKRLQSLGLVDTRQGTGTEVLSRQPTGGRFVYSFDSVQDFRHSVGQSRLINITGKKVIANQGMADQMRCPVRTPLFRLEATRVLLTRTGRPGKPVALSTVLLPAAYAGILDELPHYDQTISDLLEQRYGVQTASIEQIIEPCMFSAKDAGKLGVKPGSLGLRFQRTYLDPGGEVFEYAISLQAGNEARLSMTIRANISR